MDDLLPVYGEKFLSYVLAVDDGAALANIPLNPQRNQVIDQLRAYALSTGDQNPFARMVNLGNVALHYVEDQQTTLANLFRMSCGGDIPDCPSTDDELDWRLARLVRDIHPGLLLPPSEEHPMSPLTGIAGGVFRHPLNRELCQAIQEDDALKLLFPTAPLPESPSSPPPPDLEVLGIQSNLVFASGRGGSFQLVMLPETIIMTAFDRCNLSGKADLAEHIRAAHEVLKDVRQLALGRTVQVPFIASFANVSIPRDVTVNFSWGTLRQRRPGDDKYLGGDQNAQLVLETTVPQKVLRKEPWGAGSSDGGAAAFNRHRADFDEWNKAVTRKINLTLYALLLSSAEQPYFAAQPVAQSLFDPLSQMPNNSWRSDSVMSPAGPTELDADSAEVVALWGDRLAHHPQGLETAMRRTVSAATSRIDPIDGFVDAVLAWENMFSDTPETTFKVCAAISMLIGPENFQDRLDFFKSLQTLYGKRSTILHGGKEPGTDEAIRYRDDATKIALDCMRKLYERPDLLQLTSSAQRGKHVLLGALPELQPDADDRDDTADNT